MGLYKKAGFFGPRRCCSQTPHVSPIMADKPDMLTLDHELLTFV